MLLVVIAAFAAIVVAFGLVALVPNLADLLAARRGTERDGAVIADSEVEFEADVGKPPPGP